MQDPAPIKVCNRCREGKPQTLDHFASDARRACRLNSICRRCQSDRAKGWYAANKDRALAVRREWRMRNRERCNELDRAKRRGESLRGDYKVEDRQRIKAQERAFRAKPEQALIKRLRRRVREAANGGYCGALLGCKPKQLRAHLEKQFKPGMSWANRSEWHVDHIRPLASFDLSKADERAAACHFTNLRPLWADENLRKAARRELLL